MSATSKPAEQPHRGRIATLAALLAGALLAVHQIAAYTLLGTSNAVAFRDVRLHNTFSDPGANDNLTIHPNWPGWSGAALAIWKGAAEWNSSHGDGSGDPHQAVVGSGGANFDYVWLGETSDVANANRVVEASSSSLGPGVFAIARIYGDNTWDILFDDPQWIWDDGPGPNLIGYDIQGVACHEFGHALGLGHSSSSGATMFATNSGTGASWRSIEGDDRAGLAAIYGSASATKPRITAISGGTGAGQVMTIAGTGFDAAANQVWFTPASPAGTWVQVTNLASSSGGTRLDVTIPAGAGAGEIHVRIPGAGGDALSNSWPFDPASTCNPDPGGRPKICSIAPLSYLNHSAAPQPMHIEGHGFNAATSVQIGRRALSLFLGEFTIVDDRNITLDVPELLDCGSVSVAVHAPAGSANAAPILVNPSTEVWLAGPATTFAGQSYPLFWGGPPGAAIILFLSFSPQPSILPGVVRLEMGNAFTDLWWLAGAVMPACGAQSFPIPIGAPGLALTFYLQSVEITAAGPPLRTSARLDVFKAF